MCLFSMHTCIPQLPNIQIQNWAPFHSVTPPIHTYVLPPTSSQTLVVSPTNLLQPFLLSNHVVSAACMKQVVLFVICFVFSLCHIGNNGENHSWQLFYSFLMFFVCFVFKVQLRYLYFCNIKCVVFFFSFIIVVMPVVNKCRDFYVY